MSTLDSKRYKEVEHQHWNSVAKNWQKWWRTIESGAEKVSKRLMELAEAAKSNIMRITTQSLDFDHSGKNAFYAVVDFNGP